MPRNTVKQNKKLPINDFKEIIALSDMKSTFMAVKTSSSLNSVIHTLAIHDEKLNYERTKQSM